jgi:hypothetical protein
MTNPQPEHEVPGPPKGEPVSGEAKPTPPPQSATPVEDTKRLFDKDGLDTDRFQARDRDGSNGTSTTHINIDAGGSRTKPVKELAEELNSLPPDLHPFRDPQHEKLIGELVNRRILVLTSYQESSAYAAGYSVVKDDFYSGCTRKALYPTRERDRNRADVDLLALTDEEFLGKEQQILLIEIDSRCAILDSAERLPSSAIGRIRDQLESHGSYIVLAIKEELFTKNPAAAKVLCHSVSHLRYLLTTHLDDHAAEEMEARLLTAGKQGGMELQELYRRVADRIGTGIDAVEGLLLELEQARTLPLAERKLLLQPITTQSVFRDDSEIHRAAAFIATYFPEITHDDFHCLMVTLLGDQTRKVERVRQVVSRDGNVASITEETTELWSERWPADADQVFRDCHLGTVIAPNGTWVVDFGEPYLRRELRAHFERHFSWYLRRQCRVLQDCGIFFALTLSSATEEALVRLFVERALADPVGFGSAWLVDLVGSMKIQMKGDPPDGPPEARLVWLLEQLELQAHLRAHFYGRLALLIREMLDRDSLRPMVREFFEYLIAVRQHDAVLDLVLELARRLRFAPHFDPLLWMRRLLDQGSSDIRQRTVGRLVALARASGPRIYEFLSGVRTWLPEAGRAPERFSVSNRVALEFPFAYCLAVARSLRDEEMGRWPSRHPLFYALPPANTAEAHRELATLVEWVLDPRGAALEIADPADPTRPAEAVRIGFVGDLIEHWSWVLDSGTADRAPEARALFATIVEEVDHRMGARERAWLQRSWSRRQDEYLAQVTDAGGPGRTAIGRRRARIDQLKRRFTALAAERTKTAPTPPNAGGMTA